jgi:hypothetical protein
MYGLQNQYDIQSTIILLWVYTQVSGNGGHRKMKI